MAVCEKHGIYYKEYCPDCKRQNYSKFRYNIKSSKKDPTIINNKEYIKKQILNYKKRCHEKFSEIIRIMYDKNGYCQCWISGKWKKTFGGLSGIHAGHYYPKARYWWLAYRKENAGPLSYDENINQRESIPAMRPKLVEIWGEEKIKKLELDAQLKPKNVDLNGQLLWLKQQLKELDLELKKLVNGAA